MIFFFLFLEKGLCQYQVSTEITGPRSLVVKEPRLRCPPPEFEPRPRGVFTWAASRPPDHFA